MTQEERDAIKLSKQMEKIVVNRYSRFMFLTGKDRVDDAIAVATEFYEWFAPEHEDDEDLILYYNASGIFISTSGVLLFFLAQKGQNHK